MRLCLCRKNVSTRAHRACVPAGRRGVTDWFMIVLTIPARRQEIIKMTEQLIESINTGDFEAYTWVNDVYRLRESKLGVPQNCRIENQLKINNCTHKIHLKFLVSVEQNPLQILWTRSKKEHGKSETFFVNSLLFFSSIGRISIKFFKSIF